jgi:two-component system, OmpR family, response regulator
MCPFTLSPQRWTERLPAIDGRPPRVLVVDDYQASADALAAYLGTCRLVVRAVYSGAEALATAVQWSPDIVLLDISMPELDGFAVAQALRRDERTSSAIIVALTAHDEAYLKERASVVEFDAYCQKGLMLEPLVSLLSELTQETPCEGIGQAR